MFIIYVIDLSTKNKMQTQGFIFLQKSKINTVGNRKKNFFHLIYFRKFQFFISAFVQKMLNVSSEHSFKTYDLRKQGNIKKVSNLGGDMA